MPTPVRKPLRFMLVLSMGLLIGYWFFAGAHTGWSMNRVPFEQTDEITGLVYTTYDERYVPGIEILGGGLTLVLVFLGLTFLPFKSSK